MCGACPRTPRHPSRRLPNRRVACATRPRYLIAVTLARANRIFAAISDDETSDTGVVKSDVVTKKHKPSYKEPAEDEFDDEFDDEDEDLPDANGVVKEEDDDDDEDLDEDEFVVEKIFSHIIADDVCFSEPPFCYSLYLGHETYLTV